MSPVIPGVPAAPGAPSPTVIAQNPHLRWGDPGLRGFYVLDCTPERLQAAWYLLPAGSVEQRERQRTVFSSAWSTLHNANKLSPGGEPAAPRENPPALAPWEPA